MAKNRNEPGSETYVIRLQGHLDDSWADWFEGLTFTRAEDGTTTLIGEIADQAALHGVLKKIRDLGLPLLSINHLDLDLGVSSKEN